MGAGGSVQPNDEEDEGGDYGADSVGIEQRIPIEFTPRKRLGKAPRAGSQHQLMSLRSLNSSFTNSSSSHKKHTKGASLRSVLSNDTAVLEYEGHIEFERLKREFDNFKLNKHNEIADMQKREKKLESENKRLRGEIQALQQASARLRNERDLAYENEHQALERAAVFEQDRDNIQRELRVLRDQMSAAPATLGLNLNGSNPAANTTQYSAHNESEHVGSESSCSPGARNSGRSSNGAEAGIVSPGVPPTLVSAVPSARSEGEPTAADATSSPAQSFKFEGSVNYHAATRLGLTSSTFDLEIAPEDMVYSKLSFVIGYLEMQLEDDVDQFCSTWSHKYRKNLLQNFGLDMDYSVKNLASDNILALPSSFDIAIIFLEKKLTESDFKDLSSLVTDSSRTHNFKALFCFKHVDQSLLGGKMSRFKKILSRVNSSDNPSTISIENFSNMEPLVSIVDESVDQFVSRSFSSGVIGECSCHRDLRGALYQKEAIVHHLKSAHPADEYLSQIKRHLLKEGPVAPFVVKSLSGHGKSSLLAHFLGNIKKFRPSARVLYHFTETCSLSKDGTMLMKRFSETLHQMSGMSSLLSSDTCLTSSSGSSDSTGSQEFSRLLETFPRRSSSAGRLLIIAIDSADMLTDAACVLDWIRDPLPVDVRVILSVSSQSCPQEWEGMPSLTVRPPSSSLPASTPEFIVNNCKRLNVQTPLLQQLLAVLDQDVLPPDRTNSSSDYFVFELYLRHLCASCGGAISLFQLYSVLFYISLWYQGVRLNWLVRTLASESVSLPDFNRLICTVTNKLVSSGVLCVRRGNFIIAHEFIRKLVHQYISSNKPEMTHEASRVILSFLNSLNFTDSHPPLDLVLEKTHQLCLLQDFEELRTHLIRIPSFMHLHKYDYSHFLIQLFHQLGVEKCDISDQFTDQILRMETSVDQIGLLTDTLEALAAFNRDLLNFSKAAHLYQKSLELRESNLDPDHPSVGRTLYLYALLHFKWGKFDVAETFLRQSIAIHESTDCINYNHLLESYELLGVIFQHLGKQKPAELNSKKLVYLRSMACINKYLDSSGMSLSSILSEANPDSLVKANYLNELAVLTYHQGHVEDAESYFMSSLQIRQKLLGETHIDCSQSKFNLGGLHLETKQYSKAIEMFEETLHIRKGCNAQPRQLLSTHKCLATAYRKAGNNNRAVTALKECLRLNAQMYGENHPLVAAAYSNLAAVNSEMKNHKDALPQYERALEIFRGSQGDNDHKVADVLSNMALLKYEMGEYYDAASLYKQAMQCRQMATPTSAATALVGNRRHRRNVSVHTVSSEDPTPR